MKLIKHIVRILIFLSLYNYPVDIGSDTAVTRFLTQQVLKDGDRLATFAGLEEGFKLSAVDATATFDSIFPVSGPIDLNGGTLILDRDLILNNVATIGFLGNIIGNNHIFELSPSVTCIPTVSTSLLDCMVVVFASESMVNEPETVDWSFDSRFIASGSDGGTSGGPLFVYEFDGSSLTLRDQTTPTGGSDTTINEVKWHPSKYFLAVVRESTSPDVIMFSFNTTTKLLTQISSDSVSGDAHAAAWHPTGDYLAVGGTSSDEITIYPVNSSGILDTAGKYTLNIAPDVSTEALEWDVTGSFLAVGGNTSPELSVYEFNDQPSLNLTLNASATPGSTVTGSDWNPTFTNILAIGRSGTVGDLVLIYEHNASLGTLTQVASIPGLLDTVEGVDWNNQGNCLAIGRDETLGVGKFRTYVYDNVLKTLILVSDFDYPDDVEAVRWSPDGKFVASGEDDNTLAVYGSLGENEVTFTNLKTVLNCGVTFKTSKITFNGINSINGQGYELILTGSSFFTIDSNSTLLLKDIIVKDINSNAIKLTDGSSKLILNNVIWIQDDNFNFNTGSFEVNNNVIMVGRDLTFNYQSDQRSSINQFSTLMCNDGFTFKYEPASTSRDLLQFIDRSSILHLFETTLHSTSTGMQLTKGTLVIDGECPIISEATSQSEGVELGDGVSATNNIRIKVLPESGLKVQSGYLINKNV